jgi:hypothetical protein
MTKRKNELSKHCATRLRHAIRQTLKTADAVRYRTRIAEPLSFIKSVVKLIHRIHAQQLLLLLR